MIAKVESSSVPGSTIVSFSRPVERTGLHFTKPNDDIVQFLTFLNNLKTYLMTLKALHIFFEEKVALLKTHLMTLKALHIFFEEKMALK